MKADRDKVVENSLTLKTKLERQVGELRLKLEKEEGDRQEVEGELEIERTARQKAEKELKQVKENPPEIDFDFAGKAADLKNWLGKILGKGLPKQVTVKEIRKILEGTQDEQN